MHSPGAAPMTDAKDLAAAAKGIVEAVPVYQDAVQPAAKEIGKALQTVGKAVNVALAPLSVLVWGYERISDYVAKRVTEKLADTPADQIVSPSPLIAGPAMEALRFAGEEPDLREMYATLLASAMDRRTASRAHPAFVEIIKQLSATEGRILIALWRDGLGRPVVDVYAFDEGSQVEWQLARNLSSLPDEVGEADS